MKKSNMFQKLTTSTINVIIVLIIFLPFYFFIDNILIKKLILISIFFIYNILFILLKNNRCIWMIIMKTKYTTRPNKLQYLIYTILYTLSFSTLLFWFFFPFDLFLFNIIILQLPVIIFKKTTLHWYISWNITTATYN